MTKRTCRLGPILGVALVLAVVGCGSGSTSLTQQATPQSQTSVGTATESDASVTTDPAAVASVSDEDVLFKTNTEAALQVNYSTVAELTMSERVQTIVKGKIIDVKGVVVGDQVMSRVTVAVDHAYKGTPGDLITVYEWGGLVKVRDMLGSLKGRVEADKLTEADLDKYVDSRFMGAPHSESGQSVILYLYRSPDSQLADMYMVVTGPFGKFTFDAKTGCYVRHDASLERVPQDGDVVTHGDVGTPGAELKVEPFETTIPAAALEGLLTQ